MGPPLPPINFVLLLLLLRVRLGQILGRALRLGQARGGVPRLGQARGPALRPYDKFYRMYKINSRGGEGGVQTSFSRKLPDNDQI